jgi:cytochrome P450
MQADPIARVSERFERYGDVYYAPLLGRDIYALRHPADLHEVFVTQASKFEKPRHGMAADQLRRLLGDGLLTSNGELWRQQRRLIQPAFRKERLAEYARLIVAQSSAMLQHWEGGSCVDISQSMMELTLRIVCKTLFDHDVSGERDRVATAMRAFRGAFGGLDAVLPDWLVTPARRRTLDALAQMDAIVYALIERPARPGSHDLLSALAGSLQASAGEGMSRRQLRDELLTLFIAGHETTAHALSWTLHLLATHPEVAARLSHEIDAVVGARPPELSDLFRIPYLEQVFCEALRLFPPAYVLARVAIERAEVAGYTIPRGANVVLWIYHVHHDPRWYPEPERFDPERFSGTRRRAIPASAFVPFGAGTRSCIGKQFAMLEAQLVLSCILQRFRLEPASAGVARDTAMTLAPRGGLRLFAHPRARSAAAPRAEPVPELAGAASVAARALAGNLADSPPALHP